MSKDWRKAKISNFDRQTFIQDVLQFRRVTWRSFVFNVLHTFGDFDFSLPQVATLFVLDEEGELTVKQVAELLGRSVSTTSRLLDQLVGRGLVSRREDEYDRRAKRIALTDEGRAFIAQLELERAETQVAVVEHLSEEEQAEVARGMALLARASKVRKSYEHSEASTTGQRSSQ